jgi:predicted ATPase/DNA-binding XRE family transcriptional regulator
MQEETSFGGWLRSKRRTLDLTRQALADQVGCAEVTVRRIEGGTLKPSKELADILLEKIGIPEAERPQWISFARGIVGFPASVISSPNRSLTNLPAQITSYIGREKEQTDVLGLISKHRLITFTGSGGVGKTRFAIKTGERILGNYPDGVWLVELDSINDPELVPQTIATLFGLATHSDISHIDLLINFLRTKSALLILDNCEHLVDACAHLADTLLKNCPNLKVLVTSRVPLETSGEALYRVPSLGLPDPQYRLDTLRDCEAVKLFEERAQLVQLDFSLTSENVSSVVQVCERLDGIPLAIELAAAKVGVFSPAQIAEQLEESFNLLTGGSRTALPHHQTLRASMDWSWSLLTESEQKLMSQLAVFAGGWTLEAAQAICDGDVLHLLDSLLGKSLIVRDQITEINVRYSFHEIIRQYSREKLFETDETAHMRDRHLDYFIQLAEQGFKELQGPNDLVWFDKLDMELDNLRAALRWSLESPDADPQKALQLSGAMQDFWDTRGYTSEGYQWTSNALKNAPDSPSSHHCRALVGAGLMCHRLSRIQDGLLYLEEAIVRARQLDNTPLLIMSLLLSAHVMNDREEARKRYTECMELARATRNSWCLIEVLATWPNLDISETIRYLEEARDIADELGNARRRALVLYMYGGTEMFRAHYNSATSMLEKALRLNKMIKDRHNTALSLIALGKAACRQTHYGDAARYGEQAVQILRDLSDFNCCAGSLLLLGWNAYLAGDSDLAVLHLEESLYLYREKVDIQNGPSLPMVALGRIAISQSDLSRAIDFFRESLELLKLQEVNEWLARCLEGMCAISQIRNEKAARFVGKAEAIREQEAIVLPLSERPLIDPILERLRSQLGEDVFDSARAAGASLTYQQAIDEALEVLQSIE